jgi:dipeptidyl-peptidase-3
MNPVTKKPVATWYKPGETWGSVFKGMSSTWEECRAECVAMHLCTDRSVLDIFHVKEKQAQEDMIYICYLNMARAGLVALEFYDPNAAKWGQAHMQARYAILQVFLKAGAVTIQGLNGSNP